MCSAHKGFAWLEVQVEGKAAHGSRPQEGIDAIRQMGHLLERLDRLDQHLQTTPLDPLLGSGSLHTSFISGGREWSSYPDRCVLRYERRTVPPENETTVRNELDCSCRLSQSDAAFRGKAEMVFSRAPFQQDRNHPLVRRFRDLAVQQLSGLADWGTVSFWTDAALIAAAGIPPLSSVRAGRTAL
ncbi:MAG: peptidase dimerization domain-containing protein [Terriglobia bacterium]